MSKVYIDYANRILQSIVIELVNDDMLSKLLYYVNESEEEPLYNIYDGNEYYYFEQQDKQVKLIYFSVTYFIFMIKQIITFVFNFHIIKYKKYITKEI